MWEATEPHAICGFAVTRETAEALLMVQPTGTFLVRLSSQPGALAIRWPLLTIFCLEHLFQDPF